MTGKNNQDLEPHVRRRERNRGVRMTVTHHNARYAKLRGQVNFRNRYRFQSNFKLKVLETRGFTFIIEEHSGTVNLPPILINKVRVPFRLHAYCRTEVRTDDIPFCGQKRLRDINDSTCRLCRATARFLNNDVSFDQLPLCKRVIRDKTQGERRIVMLFNRHNISRPNAVTRLWSRCAFSFATPISADELSDGVI